MTTEQYIFAPFTKYTKTVLVNSNDKEQSYRVTGFSSSSFGFGLFRLVDSNCARFITQSDHSVAFNYLHTLPCLDYILAYESDLGWISYPQNLHDMKSKIGYDREVVIRNVENGNQFDTIKARFDGLHLWYDIHDTDHSKSQRLREVFSFTEDYEHVLRKAKRIKDITHEDLEAVRLAIGSTVTFNTIHRDDNVRISSNSIVPGKNVENNWKYRKLNKPHQDINILTIGFYLNAQKDQNK